MGVRGGEGRGGQEGTSRANGHRDAREVVHEAGGAVQGRVGREGPVGLDLQHEAVVGVSLGRAELTCYGRKIFR